MKKHLIWSVLIIIFLFAPPYTMAQNSVQDKLVQRLVKYAAVNTQSDYESSSSPTTSTQTAFAQTLAQELKAIGLSNVSIDQFSYVRAEVPATVKGAPTIFLNAHTDTTPDEDLKGANPKPVVHDYQGGNLKIADGLILTPEKEPFLATAAGGKVVTSDGNTILGADDKCGIAILVTLAEILVKDKKAKHGTVKFIFTTDEEIGYGTRHLTKSNIGADYGLVLDSRGHGRLVIENFNAADFKIEIKAPPAGHPGTQNMPSASFIKDDILKLFPSDLRAYTTKGKEGYASYYKVEDKGSTSIIHGRIREHDMNAFDSLREMVVGLVNYYSSYLKAKYKDAGDELSVSLSIRDSYYNSKEILEKSPLNYDILLRAYKLAGVPVMAEATRGGSDANDITFLGIPSYNMFAGYHNEHSIKEWASAKQMEDALNIALKYLSLWAETAYAKDLKINIKDSVQKEALKFKITIPNENPFINK